MCPSGYIRSDHELLGLQQSSTTYNSLSSCRGSWQDMGAEPKSYPSLSTVQLLYSASSIIHVCRFYQLCDSKHFTITLHDLKTTPTVQLQCQQKSPIIFFSKSVTAQFTALQNPASCFEANTNSAIADANTKSYIVFFTPQKVYLYNHVTVVEKLHTSSLLIN